MKIIQGAWLIPVFIFSNAYSQIDSTPVVRDTTFVNPDTTVQTVESSVEKKDPMHKIKSGQVYKLKPAVDIPVVAAGTIWSLYAFTKIYNKTPPTVEQVQNLKTSDVPSYDRWAVYPYSKSLDDISYIPFYTAIPLPFVFFLTEKEMRRDYFKLSFLYWETMSVTGLFGISATYFVDKYRPYAYRSETPMEKRTGSVAWNSFYAGHVEVVAASTFFISKVYSDYNPDSKIKWVFYGVASATTAATAYMRLRGGQHFPSDIFLGAATGVLDGILVPHFHKISSSKNSSLIILPYSTGESHGFALTYHFKK